MSEYFAKTVSWENFLQFNDSKVNVQNALSEVCFVSYDTLKRSFDS
jgi:hypothetical protein